MQRATTTCMTLLRRVRLVKYSKKHFISEENYMPVTGHIYQLEHELEHNYFKAIVRGYCARSFEGESNFAVEVAEFIATWLSDHILLHDMRLNCRSDKILRQGTD